MKNITLLSKLMLPGLLIFVMLSLFIACGSGGGNGGNGDDDAVSGTGDAGTGSGDEGSGSDDDGTDAGETDDGSGDGGNGGGGGGGNSDLPVGIPQPSFGWNYDTENVAATIYVDNTNPDCSNNGGSESQPLCDLFQGRDVIFSAGDVVHVMGGPYILTRDHTVQLNGTEDQPVIISGVGADRILFDAEGRTVEFDWEGSYAIIENLDFYHKTRHYIDMQFAAFRNLAVHNPDGAFVDFNPVVSVTGHDVLIHESEIFNNRRNNDRDTHGIQASEGSYNVWILENELYNNNGDAFQGCHHCWDSPPHHIYIGGNTMHEDRENGIDLKSIHDVVISENVLYGYSASSTSNGDAMVIGSNGFDDSINQGPRRIWVINNEFRDSAKGIRVEGSEDVWLIGNVLYNLEIGIQMDDKPHRDITIAANTIFNVGDDGIRASGCRPDELIIQNNILDDIDARHLDIEDCNGAQVEINNNFFGGVTSARVDNTQFNGADSLNGEFFASGNLEGDPDIDDTSLVPNPDSPAVDAGVSLDDIYTVFENAFGVSIAEDCLGTSRPNNAQQDIGALER